MFRRFFVLLALLLSLAIPIGLSYAAGQSHAAVQTKDCTVYVTSTGHKYHRAWCQYLKSNAIKLSRSEAIKGGYTPCKRCGGSECEP
jgi:methylphosphotriester-DNA--protein-cysteine methyltransferase